MAKSTKKKSEHKEEDTSIVEHTIMVTPEGEELIIIAVDMYNKIVFAKEHNGVAKWYGKQEYETWEQKK